MHAWARYTELEQHLAAIAERIDPPLVWRPKGHPTPAAFVDWTDEEWIRVEDKRALSFLGSEVIQHLRAALDHAVYNAGWKASGSRPKRTQFPIIQQKSEWNRARKTMLGPLSAQHVEWLEAVQPYNGVSWTKDLQLLSNMDKHRFALEISPSVQIQIDHGVTFADPNNGTRVLLQVDAVKILAVLVGDTKHRNATSVLPDMFAGAAELINRFLIEDGVTPIRTFRTEGERGQ